MKKLIITIITFIIFIFPVNLAFAAENKFGIHILEPSDLAKAQELVNSSGGDWGWVTIVIRDDDMNYDKWQGFMDECRERHLIPLVRIATHLEGPNWAKPKEEDSEKWVNFLNSLNWPVKDQYVIIFNEPNQAKEWGGEVNPREYSRILSDFSAKFKVQSPVPSGTGQSAKFKILNAGLDIAAPNGKETMEAFKFMQEMNWEIPGIFEKLDGWTSHSYPNHGFLGKPWENGKTSIKGFEWELAVLKKTFKVQKNLPVFITETGWPTQDNKSKIKNQKYYDEATVGTYLKYAFENVWLKDDRVKAVTPFVLNYPGDLFADFSWLDKKGNPYQRCETIKNIGKSCLWPEQEEKYELVSITLPPFLPANTKFNGELILKNIGQSILGEQRRLEIPVNASENLQVSNLVIPNNQKIKPNEIGHLDFSITSTNQPGEYEFYWENLPKQKIKVFPASIISRARYTFWQKVSLKISNVYLSLALKIQSILKTLSK